MHFDYLRKLSGHPLNLGTWLSYCRPSVLRGRINRYRSRQQLLDLPQERLDDIGLTREQALEEAQKPFWQ